MGKNKIQTKGVGKVKGHGGKPKQKRDTDAEKVKKYIKEKAREEQRPRRVDRRDPRDERTTKTMSSDSALALSNESIVIEARALQDVYQGIAIGILSYALQKSFQSFSSQPSAPYHAFCYLVESLSAAASNGTPLLTQTPHAVNLIMESLKPKNVPSTSGRITYRYDVNTNFQVPNWFLQMTSGGSWAIGDPTSTYVNGLWPSMQAPSSFNSQNGSQALSALYQFCAKTRNTKMIEMVQSGSRNKMSTDASAFAVSAGDPGTGYANFGAPRSLVTLEVPVTSPLFGNINSPSLALSLPLNRAAQFARAHGGDCVSLGGMLIGLLEEDQISFKKPPIYKALDAEEFYDQLALIVQAMVQEAFGDLQINQQFQGSSPIDPSSYCCPLTFQEFKLLIRNVLMTAVSNTQFFAQGLVFQPQSISQGTFQTYKVACGTIGQAAVAMPKLPVAFIEEINCNTYRCNMGGKGGRSNPDFTIPVLGEYIGTGLRGEDYIATVNVNDQLITKSVFASPPVTVRGKESVSAETTISMVDGSAGGGFVYINDTQGLNRLAELWNAWYSKLSTFVDTSDVYIPDGGVSVLNQSIMTNHYAIGNPQEKRAKDPRFKLVEIDNGYAIRKVAGLTSQVRLDATVQQFTSTWIKPSNYLNDVGATPGTSSGFQKMATVYREPHQIGMTAGGFVDLTLATQHVNFARIVTHARNGVDSGMTNFVKEMRAKGHGGILSTLASQFIPPLAAAAAGAIQAIPY